MPDAVDQLRATAAAIGLTIPEERLPMIATSVAAALQQVEAIRITPTPVPAPTAFDAAWSPKK